MKITLNLRFRKKKKSYTKKTYPIEIQNIYDPLKTIHFNKDNPMRKMKTEKKPLLEDIYSGINYNEFKYKNPLFSEIIKNTVETEKKSNVKIMFVLTIFIIYIIWTLSTQ